MDFPFTLLKEIAYVFAALWILAIVYAAMSSQTTLLTQLLIIALVALVAFVIGLENGKAKQEMET